MRRFLGPIVSFVLAFALVGAMFALKPNIELAAKRADLSRAADQLSSYPFTPLISTVRVVSAS